MCNQNSRVLAALKTLEACGVDRVENVKAAIAASEDVAVQPEEGVVADLRDYLEACEGDVHRNVCTWVAQQGWFWNCVNAYPEIGSMFSTPACSDAVSECDEEASACPAAADVFGTASILQAELASQQAADVFVHVEMADSCTSSFGAFVDEAKDVEHEHDVACSYVNYPVQKRSGDAIHGVKHTRVLMQAGFRMSTDAKEAELLVNLVGEGSAEGFTNYSIITSQGEMHGLARPEMNAAMASMSRVQRCYDFASAIHQFKMAMWTVADHMVKKVVPEEFADELEARLTPASQPSESYLSAVSTGELYFETQESQDSCTPLTPLSPLQ